MSKKINDYIELAGEKIIEFTPKILITIFIIWIGFKIIKKLIGVFEIVLQKSGISKNVHPFLISIVHTALKIAILFVAAQIIGIELSIFATIIAASFFAIGMSLQGSLGNFASGLIILTLKQYNIGDWIQIDDKFGKVEEIGVFNSVLITPGNKTLIIPNAKITSDIVINYSKKGIIRLELSISMPYEESFPKVKALIMEAIKSVPTILDTPETEIGIENYDSHSLQIAVRPYVKPDHYWEATYDTYANIKNIFHQNNIKVAYSEGIELGNIGA